LSFPVTFWMIIDLQCCSYSHLPSDFPSKFHSSMTTFHHKLLTREGTVLANGWIETSSMTIFVHFIHKYHPKTYHSDIKHHLTLKYHIKYNFLPSISPSFSWVPTSHFSHLFSILLWAGPHYFLHHPKLTHHWKS
jgi:hypothetical protein